MRGGAASGAVLDQGRCCIRSGAPFRPSPAPGRISVCRTIFIFGGVRWRYRPFAKSTLDTNKMHICINGPGAAQKLRALTMKHNMEMGIKILIFSGILQLCQKGGSCDDKRCHMKLALQNRTEIPPGIEGIRYEIYWKRGIKRIGRGQRWKQNVKYNYIFRGRPEEGRLRQNVVRSLR